MSEIATRPVHQADPPERKLWFGILAAPASWAVNELAGVAVVGRTCGSAGTLAGWQWMALIGLAVAALLVSAWGGLTALGVFRGWSGGESPASSDGLGRVEFMALAGVLVSAFLLLNILFFGLMPFIVDPCLRTT